VSYSPYPKSSFSFIADTVPKIVTLLGGLLLVIHLINQIKDTYNTIVMGIIGVILLFIGIFLWFLEEFG
jgi:hypothetical protein